MTPIKDFVIQQKFRKPFYQLTLAAGLVALCVVLIFSSQPGSEQSFVEVKPASNVPPVRFTPSAENYTRDPGYSMGNCENINFNTILLMERSRQLLDAYTPEQVETLKTGAKLFLSNLSAMARNRENAKAHVIIGAFATYNVWQNLPQSRRSSGKWTPAAKGEIDITQADNLRAALETIDNLYMAIDPLAPPHIGSSAEAQRKGYLGDGVNGIDPSRSNVTNFRESNIDDALIQASREISRWVDGRATVGPQEDMDLVMLVTRGQPNVNNGRRNYPSRTQIFRPQYDIFHPDFFLGIGPWRSKGQDDLWRAREAVERLRTGAALRGYSVPGGETPHIEASPAYSGARPPVRVYGQTLIPPGHSDSQVIDDVYDMSYMLGWEWADYSGPGRPTLAIGNEQAIIDSHRHFDKTVGTLEENELVTDMVRPLADIPCPGSVGQVKPNIQIDVDVPGPITIGQDVTAKVTITNVGGTSETNFPVENLEVRINADPNPKPRMRPMQFETTSADPNCPYHMPDWALLVVPVVPCHYTLPVQQGMEFVGGILLPERIDLLEVGESATLTFTFATSEDNIANLMNEVHGYVNGKMVYDLTTQIALNNPTPDYLDDGVTPDPNKNRGYFWLTDSDEVQYLSPIYPT